VKNDDNNAKAEEALIELHSTINDVRTFLAAREEEEKEDTGDAEGALVEDEDTESDNDHPAAVATHHTVSKELALRQIDDSKQATADSVKPGVAKSALLK
jgi:hypothetical protein